MFIMKLVDMYTRVEIRICASTMVKVLGLIGVEYFKHGVFWDALEDAASVLNMVIIHDAAYGRIYLKMRNRYEPDITIKYSLEDPRTYKINVRTGLEKDFTRLLIKRLLLSGKNGVDVEINVKHVIEYEVDKFIEPTTEARDVNNVKIVIEKYPIVETMFAIRNDKRMMLDEVLVQRLIFATLREVLVELEEVGEIFDFTIRKDRIYIDYYNEKDNTTPCVTIYYTINNATLYDPGNMKLWIDFEEENYDPRKLEIYNSLIWKMADKLRNYEITHTTTYKLREIRYVTGIST